MNYNGFEVLSDHGSFVASFIPQFAWYTLKDWRSNPFNVQMMENWLLAEKSYWSDCGGRYDSMTTWGKDVTGRVYGSSAGDCPNNGYCVLDVGGTKSGKDTWSAAIMGGFIGAVSGSLRDEVNDDIDWLYENEVCTYTKTTNSGVSSTVLWRCSVDVDNSDWVADRPTGVDFATMIFGYATNFLPENFFDTYAV